MTALRLMLAMMLVGVVGVGSGCSMQPRSASTDTEANQDLYPQVVVIDPLKVSKHQPIVTESDGVTPMRVTVPVRLKSNKSQEVQYRFVFLDRKGRPVGPAMDWRWKVMPARALIYMEGEALDTDAVDWRLEIRENLESK